MSLEHLHESNHNMFVQATLTYLLQLLQDTWWGKHMHVNEMFCCSDPAERHCWQHV